MGFNFSLFPDSARFYPARLLETSAEETLAFLRTENVYIAIYGIVLEDVKMRELFRKRLYRRKEVTECIMHSTLKVNNSMWFLWQFFLYLRLFLSTGWGDSYRYFRLSRNASQKPKKRCVTRVTTVSSTVTPENTGSTRPSLK